MAIIICVKDDKQQTSLLQKQLPTSTATSRSEISLKSHLYCFSYCPINQTNIYFWIFYQYIKNVNWILNPMGRLLNLIWLLSNDLNNDWFCVFLCSTHFSKNSPLKKWNKMEDFWITVFLSNGSFTKKIKFGEFFPGKIFLQEKWTSWIFKIQFLARLQWKNVKDYFILKFGL